MTESPSPAEPQRPTWMLVVFGIACLVVLLNAGIFLYGLTRPDSWTVKESIVIDAPPERVAAAISDPSRWTRWSMWSAANDSTLETETSGPDSGPKATLRWAGRRMGQGKLVITAVSEEGSGPAAKTIEYDLYRQGELFSENGRFALIPKEGGTRVVWTDSGEIGSTIGRVFFRERFLRRIAADYARSLEQLKGHIEGRESGMGSRE